MLVILMETTVAEWAVEADCTIVVTGKIEEADTKTSLLRRGSSEHVLVFLERWRDGLEYGH
jgi:hypothetical protein